MSEKIECKRVKLRPLTLHELEELDAKNQKILAESALSEVIKLAIKQKIERMQRAPKEVHPWLTYWLIEQSQKNQGIGLIGSKFLPDEEGYVELGYVLAREYRTNGYMREAMEGFLDWLYEWSFCNGARLLIRPANLPSIRVAEACGFTYIKTEDIYRIYRYDFELK